MSRGFCTQISEALHEPLPGTGGHQRENLLIRWPKGGWGKNLAVAPDMPEGLAHVIETLKKGGRRVNLIDRKAEAPGTHRLYLYPERLTRVVGTVDLAVAIGDVDRGDLTGWQRQDRPVLLACTHGKKDRCCAKFGFAAYSELARRAGPDGPEVWESTHLGGCRLSASALSFPAMRKYGRVRPENVADLLADEAADRPWLPGWRGASHLPPEGQVAGHLAESWARARGGRIAQFDADGAHWTAVVELPDGQATLHLKPLRQTVTRPGTCDDLDSGAFATAETWTAYIARVTRSLAA